MSADAALMCVGGGARTPTEAGKRMHKHVTRRKEGKAILEVWKGGLLVFCDWSVCGVV
jgi:hypothetical protein